MTFGTLRGRTVTTKRKSDIFTVLFPLQYDRLPAPVPLCS
jgi:hypothetical protein